MRILHPLLWAKVANCAAMRMAAIATPSVAVTVAMPRTRIRTVRPWICPQRWRPAIALAPRNCALARWSADWTVSTRCADARVRCRSVPPMIRTVSAATEVCATMHPLSGGRRKSKWLWISSCRLAGGHCCSTGGQENPINKHPLHGWVVDERSVDNWLMGVARGRMCLAGGSEASETPPQNRANKRTRNKQATDY